MGKVIPIIFLVAGIFVLIQTILPLINFKIWEIEHIKQEDLLASPISEKGVFTNRVVLGVTIQNTDNFPSLVSFAKREFTPYTNFSISIENLKIEDANVGVDSNDFKTSLAHLPGTSLPGEKGNVFISGHSSLPIAYNGNEGNFLLRNKNYGAIFAKLHTLKKGDLIKVQAGGQFTYQVLGFKIVDPKDLSVIYPPDGIGRYITLMTCVPPGLNTKRLVVLGKMI